MLRTGQSLRAHTSVASSGTKVVPTCLERPELEQEPMDIQEMVAEQERTAEPKRVAEHDEQPEEEEE
jgi:hypothetical protein